MTTVTLSSDAVRASMLHCQIEQENQTILRLTEQYRSKRQELDELAARISAAVTLRAKYRAALKGVAP